MAVRPVTSTPSYNANNPERVEDYESDISLQEAGSTPPSSHDDKTSDGEKSRKEQETPPIDDKAVEMMKMRLDEAVSHNNVLKKENGDLKTKLSACLTPEQTARLKNDNKRLLSLTERINKQRTNLEEKLNNKKTECGNLEKDLSANKEQLETVIADRNKLKEMVENLLAEIEKQREEIRVLKDGKSFADFVELKRQIKELKTENGVLSNGLKCDNKGSLKFNLNDLATMLRLKQGDTLDALSKHNQTQRVVVLDERELEESIRRGDHTSTLCESAGGPSPPHTPNHQTRSAGMTRQSSRINFISPPRSLNTSPRTFSRQSSCRDRCKPDSFHRKTTVFPKMAFTGRTKRTIPIGFARGLDREAVYRRSLGIY